MHSFLASIKETFSYIPRQVSLRTSSPRHTISRIFSLPFRLSLREALTSGMQSVMPNANTMMQREKKHCNAGFL